MATIAIVILNHNGKNYLSKFLPIVLKYSTKSEVILADNASTDQSVAFLQEKIPEVRLIRLQKNHGFARGYNEALKQIESDYYILLNSDVEVTAGWIKPLIDFLEKNPDYCACQPKILDQNKKSHFEYAGAAGGYLDRLGYPYCRGRILNTLEEDNGQYDNEVDILWASGACMAIRSSVFHASKGFDEDYFAHMEEIDMCWRMINHGYKIRCIPSSIVYHVGGGILARSSPFKTYLNFRNSFYTLIKNLRAEELTWKLFLRILLDWLALFYFLMTGEPKHSEAILKAHISILKCSKKMLSKRKGDKGLIKGPFSIVFNYFLMRKKKFSDI